jgi:hypothetical protein
MRKILVGSAGVVVGGCAIVAALAGTGAGQTPPDPPGDNGTIKVDGLDFDSHPDNEPHVGCVFQIDFYNFDQGDFTATLTFDGQPPTGGGQLLTDQVFIGADPAGGGNDLDASKTMDLSAALAGIPPHPVQGHHVQLTVNAPGSIGNDTKHKVFWVEGCGQPPGTTTTSPTTAPPPPPSPTTTAPGQRGVPGPAVPVVAPPPFTG